MVVIVMAMATTSSSMWSISAVMMFLVSMMGKGSASMGAIRKVRFEEKPDSIYRAVSPSPLRSFKSPSPLRSFKQ